MRHDLIVVGGGIVGLATAYRFLQHRPGAGVVVLEKERAVGLHQSGHNSGVLHAGLYYRPGSSKALLAREGIRSMTEFCAHHRIAHEICGKLVVATNQAEIPRLRTLFDRGTANALRGLRWLRHDEAREIEPSIGGVSAVLVPEEGIVDFPAVCRTLAEEIGRMGGAVLTGARVVRMTRDHGGWTVETERGTFAGTSVANCGGLHADRIARLAGETPDVQIVPFRGEYFLLKAERQHLVRNLIYPVPDPSFPFLGVHLTRRALGGVEAGPNAVLALAREGYTPGTICWPDLAETMLFPGLWRFVRRYPRASWEEVRRSASRKRFAQSLKRLVPEIEVDDLERRPDVGAGVRAQAMRGDGTLVEDFELLRRSRAIHVLNAPSPAATASLAIGARIVAELEAASSV